MKMESPIIFQLIGLHRSHSKYSIRMLLICDKASTPSDYSTSEDATRNDTEQTLLLNGRYVFEKIFRHKKRHVMVIELDAMATSP